ncbi:class I SAM-dependent methyltransferase [Aestuariivivens insulae]|uniref:class I SAM-dependent methyltransferase n=1 Tax=Aestuariivivens insulae TaxID=1621988 RepID=UPI001F5860E7|nr:methyltransferase domain-containing protein [Aestuariivivens insulae]
MTLYEWFRRLTFPIMPVHLQTVHKDIKALVLKTRKSKEPIKILDVGGRKSPYTIGIPASVALLDVPQEHAVQEQLGLGFTDSILTGLQQKRSNISELIIQDMTASTLEPDQYDAVVSIEVIEHVEADALFVHHIAQVIKPGGWAYFTTPNGDYIKNEGPDKNPDHVRHYTKKELQSLMERYFDRVEVHYAVATGKYRLWGLKSFKLKKPWRLVKSVAGNIINSYESRHVADRPVKTGHLVAVGYKD